MLPRCHAVRTSHAQNTRSQPRSMLLAVMAARTTECQQPDAPPLSCWRSCGVLDARAHHRMSATSRCLTRRLSGTGGTGPGRRRTASPRAKQRPPSSASPTPTSEKTTHWVWACLPACPCSRAWRNGPRRGCQAAHSRCLRMRASQTSRGSGVGLPACLLSLACTCVAQQMQAGLPK